MKWVKKQSNNKISLVQSQQTQITKLEAENSLIKSKLNELLAEMGKETF